MNKYFLFILLSLASCDSHPLKLTSGELAQLRLKAGNGDIKSIYKLFSYYEFYENNFESSEHWLKIGAQNHDAQYQYLYGTSVFPYLTSPRNHSSGEDAHQACQRLF